MTYRSSKWNTIRIVLFLLVFLCSYVKVGAEVICKIGKSPTIQGRIVKGDFSKLLVCLRSLIEKGPPIRSDPLFTEIGWVHFSSEGGDVNEAIKIGRFLRESLAMGWVDDHCYSACFFGTCWLYKNRGPEWYR